MSDASVASAHSDPSDRYSVVAIVLHWAMALAILFNIGLAWWMHAAIEAPSTAARAVLAYQVHKSIGLTVLALAVARLAWRLMHKPPPLPDDMASWERFAARATHIAFYVVMIAVPLTGWLYVSASWSMDQNRPLAVPTIYFGLFSVPHLFAIDHMAEATRAFVARYAILAHASLVFATIGLFFLHVGAALKHWVVDRDDVLPRMAPGLPVLRAGVERTPTPLLRIVGLVSGLVLIAAGIGFVAIQLARPLPTAVAAPAPALPQLPQEAVRVVEPEAPATTTPSPTTPAAAPSRWTVNAARSAITFSGTHAGTPFEGRFSRWRATIQFDPNNLAASSAVVTIQTASAADGNPMHDEALPGEEWFNTAAHPTAVFRTTSIRHTSGNSYSARGTLTLKGQSIPLSLPFTLTINGANASMTGSATINRRAANLGMQSDPDAEYVSPDITVNVRVEATRAP